MRSPQRISQALYTFDSAEDSGRYSKLTDKRLTYRSFYTSSLEAPKEIVER